MTFDLQSIKLTDPLVLKAGGGLALYALGDSKTLRLAGLALLGWAAWDYFKPKAATTPAIPYDPDAPLPLTQGQTSSNVCVGKGWPGCDTGTPVSGDPFKGTRWEGSPLAPSIRPARPGETDASGKVIPFPRAHIHAPTPEERAMFYGINPEPDNAG